MTDEIASERRRIGEELIAQAAKLRESHGNSPMHLPAIEILSREGRRIRDGLPPIHPTSEHMAPDVAKFLREKGAG